MKKLLLCTALALCSMVPTHAQMVTTIAGTGMAGYSGDGSAATTASINHVWGMKRDGTGNLYFADRENNRIRKIDPAGIITTVAGCCDTGILTGGYSGDGGLATAAKLNAPTDIAFDGAGNMYIADGFNNRIRMVNTVGIITTFAGTGAVPGGYSGDGGPATLAELWTPTGISVDGAGNVYFSDFDNSRIRKIDTTGVIITVAGTGVGGYSGDGSPATSAQVQFSIGIVTDYIGNVYFSDDEIVIRKIDIAGIITTIAGTGVFGFGADGIPATASALGSPFFLVFDSIGNLYFSDAGNNRVRKINTSGIISTIAGNGTMGYAGDDSCLAINAEFSSPTGIAVDGAGSVYIADEINNRIRKTIPDHAPAFIGGHTQHWAVCRNTGGTIDTILTITDTDHGQTETWSLLSPPLHGVAAAAYSAASTGAALTPAGLTYTPATGYNGNDTFTVVINDCANGADTTTIYISVDTFLNVGALSGADSVCIAAAPITLTDTVPGGAWHSSNANAAVASGVVTGLTVGVDTVFYIVSNACGSDTAQHVVAVSACPSQVASPQPAPRERELLSVSPNPNEGVFTFSLSATVDENVQVVITNVVGEKMKEFATATNKQTPIMLDAPAGVYFLSATTARGRWSGKVMVVR